MASACLSAGRRWHSEAGTPWWASPSALADPSRPSQRASGLAHADRRDRTTSSPRLPASSASPPISSSGPPKCASSQPRSTSAGASSLLPPRRLSGLCRLTGDAPLQCTSPAAASGVLVACRRENVIVERLRRTALQGAQYGTAKSRGRSDLAFGLRSARRRRPRALRRGTRSLAGGISQPHFTPATGLMREPC